MSYHLTDPAEIARLRALHNGLMGSDLWLVTRFYDEIPEGEIAMAAWGVIDPFTGIDEERIRRFFNAYQGNRLSAETKRLDRGIPCITTPVPMPAPASTDTADTRPIQEAPDFQFTLYQGQEVLGRDELRLSDLRGKPVVLNFWAGLLPPSRAEMPELQVSYDQFRVQVAVVGVDVGRASGLGSQQDAEDLLAELGITYPAGYPVEEGRVFSDYQIVALPTTFFITAQGGIFRKWSGALDREILTQTIAEMLVMPQQTVAPAAPVAEQEAELVPGAVVTPVPAPTPPPPAPISIFEVTREHLPGMVLTEEDVAVEFPFMVPDPVESGYQDNEVEAEDTIDPEDTASDLEARGRIDGYEVAFSDFEILVGGETSPGRPTFATSSVDLFDTPESALAFIQRQIDDFRRFAGSQVEEGFILEALLEFDAPDVGEDTVAGRLDAILSAPGLETELKATFVVWRRGPVVAVVFVTAVNEEDYGAAVERLARRMDQRILENSP